MGTTTPEILTMRLYSYADSDRIARVTRGTSKRWLEGYTKSERTFPPVTPGRDITGDGVSFADLVEVAAIGRLRELGLSVRTIRTVVEVCQAEFAVPYPLSTLIFKTDGRDVFVGHGAILHNVLKRRSQLAWDEFLAPFLDTLDYTDNFATRWWPLGRNKPIVVDPDYGFGLPVIHGSGVRTEIIMERLRAGDMPPVIATDFNVTHDEVDAAIQFESSRERAA